jgi:hypothetical protein
MIRALILAITLEILGLSCATAGTFIGEVTLYPEGCDKFLEEDSLKKCKLKDVLTYESSNENQLVWQTQEYSTGVQSGTTNGASIPKWIRGIIGEAYDVTYLKAAIIHDHYCYKENQIRTWRETHRMFYEALLDLGVSRKKAKAMYFAVYTFGPHWDHKDNIDGPIGDNCEGGYPRSVCVRVRPVINSQGMDIKHDPQTFTSSIAQKEIAKMQKRLERKDFTLEEIESQALVANPSNLFLKRTPYNEILGKLNIDLETKKLK